MVSLMMIERLRQSAQEQTQQLTLLGQKRLLPGNQFSLLFRKPLQGLQDIAIARQPHQVLMFLSSFQTSGDQSRTIEAQPLYRESSYRRERVEQTILCFDHVARRQFQPRVPENRIRGGLW